MALNINIAANPPRCKRNDGSDWKAAAATAIAGVACYAGYKIIKKEIVEKTCNGKNWPLGPSSSSVPLQQCAICWNKMPPRKHFNCIHNFHDNCIQNYQQKNDMQVTCVEKKGLPGYGTRTCPICKAEQIPDSEKDWELVDEFDLL